MLKVGLVTVSLTPNFLIRFLASVVFPLPKSPFNKIIFEDHLEVGYNYRLTDIQAAVGIKQLEKLDLIVAERRKIAERTVG